MGKSTVLSRPHGWKALVCGFAIVGASFGAAAAAGATSPTVPGAPTITSATAGTNSIRVNFTKPASNGGSPIFNYKVTCVSSNGGATRSEIEFRSSIRVDGLGSAKTYTCTVAARNRVGYGRPSAPTAALLVLPVPPGAPTITSVATSGVRSVRVGFTRPASSGGSPIFLYKVTCASSDGGATRSEADFRSSIRVDGLTAGRTYTCIVMAKNRVGFGPPSAPSAGVLVLPIPPGAPTITSVTPGVPSISVAFSAPANASGANVSDYKATCVSSDGGVTRFDDRGSSPIVVDHLTALKTYTCTVDARNSVGFGPPSAPSAAVVTLGPTVVSAPGAPAITSVTAGSQSITVAFSAPASDGGASISDYKATCSSSDGGVTRWDDRNGSPILVVHLTAGKTYTCTVMAKNRIGFGAPSASSSPVMVLS